MLAKPLAPTLLPDLDEGIRYATELLRAYGFHTYESCEGGEGHAYREPTVRFKGSSTIGYAAISTMFMYGLPVRALRRFWGVHDGELWGPDWEIAFSEMMPYEDEHKQVVLEVAELRGAPLP